VLPYLPAATLSDPRRLNPSSRHPCSLVASQISPAATAVWHYFSGICSRSQIGELDPFANWIGSDADMADSTDSGVPLKNVTAEASKN